MKVGDLVMWLGHDKDHGCLGIIVEAFPLGHTHYSVLWYDGITGVEIAPEKLRKLEDELQKLQTDKKCP